MKTIGITGGIGSGKSTFCSMLEECGAQLFNADLVASRIMETDAVVRGLLVQLLGEEAYLDNGKLNRPFISSRAFSEPMVLTRIGTIVHPAVHVAFEEAQEKARREKCIALIREAAIPPDENTRTHLDMVVSVMADKELRVQRVMERSALSREEVEARISAQATDAEFIASADQVVWNNGSVQALGEQAQSLWNEWVLS